MKVITLTDAQYNELLLELRALEIYRWNDSRISAIASPSKVLPVIEASVKAHQEISKENPLQPIKGTMWLAQTPGGTIELIPTRRE